MKQDDQLLVLMSNRCLKMYDAINQIGTIFKLLDERQILSKSESMSFEEDEFKSTKINERILTAIKAFLIEHAMMPVQFNFGGEDILYNLKNPLHKSGNEPDLVRQQTYDATFMGRQNKVKRQLSDSFKADKSLELKQQLTLARKKTRKELLD